MPNIVLADSSVLIGLGVIDALALLPPLFGYVLVTDSVWNEVVERRPGRPGSDAARAGQQAGWIRRIPDLPGTLAPALGPGETSTILAGEQLENSGESVLLLLDDPRARTESANRGLPVLGLLGILLRSKTRGLVPLVGPLIEHLTQAGFHIHPRLREAVLQAAGEPIP